MTHQGMCPLAYVRARRLFAPHPPSTIPPAALIIAAPAARSIYTLPDLKYGYGELEPIISGEIMEIHHSKHHNT